MTGWAVAAWADGAWTYAAWGGSEGEPQPAAPPRMELAVFAALLNEAGRKPAKVSWPKDQPLENGKKRRKKRKKIGVVETQIQFSENTPEAVRDAVLALGPTLARSAQRRRCAIAALI